MEVEWADALCLNHHYRTFKRCEEDFKLMWTLPVASALLSLVNSCNPGVSISLFRISEVYGWRYLMELSSCGCYYVLSGSPHDLKNYVKRYVGECVGPILNRYRRQAVHYFICGFDIHGYHPFEETAGHA